MIDGYYKTIDSLCSILRVSSKAGGGVYMAINSVSNSIQNENVKTSNVSKSVTKSVTESDTKPIAAEGEAAAYEKTHQEAVNSKSTYSKDAVTISDISKQVEKKLASLRAAVEKLFTTQSAKNSEAQGLTYEEIMEKYDGKLKDFYEKLEVDDSTRLAAQQDISEDGFWGVKQTSERAIAFAKALSGGDPSKIELLKNSIEEGYKAAEKAWGGELPEISKKTQEATLKGLDDWAKEASQKQGEIK